MINQTETSLLHVAFPSNATAQQPPLNCATGGATGAQQPPAKPASLLDIARNKLRNMHATSAEKGTQQPPVFVDEAVAQSQARNKLNSAKQENPTTMRDSSLLHVAFPSKRNMQQAHWRWLLHYPDHDVELTATPEPTLAEVLLDFPGVIAAEPIPDTPKRKPTEAEAKKLRELVAAIYSTDTEADQAEALAAALADPDGALICYRSIRDTPEARPEHPHNTGKALPPHPTHAKPVCRILPGIGGQHE